MYSDEVNEMPAPYRWTWGLDDIDLSSEDVDADPFEAVNAKACKPEDREKKAPTPPRRWRRPKKKTEASAWPNPALLSAGYTSPIWETHH